MILYHHTKFLQKVQYFTRHWVNSFLKESNPWRVQDKLLNMTLLPMTVLYHVKFGSKWLNGLDAII